MSIIYYKGKQYSGRENETVLQIMMRHGVTVPFSCGNGICHVCLQRCEKGTVPTNAQNGLRDSLKQSGYFLPCKCIPQGDMQITPPRDSDLFHHAVIYKKEMLSPYVCRLLLEPAIQLSYHAGQFINIRNQNGIQRSYSLASVPQEDYFLELHIQRVPDGIMSNWIFNELSEGDEIEFLGVYGNNHYASNNTTQPLLLICTGTGLAPLLGIAREALLNGHNGPIHLYHGSSNTNGLYLRDTLDQLASTYPNFHPTYCVSGINAFAQNRTGRANKLALTDHPDLSGWQVYLCGNPEMTKDTKIAVLAAGATHLDIHSDAFWTTPDMHHSNNMNSPENKNENLVLNAKKSKYPPPDLELWCALDQGRLLSKILSEFYDRVYEDPLLAPFFNDVTKRRVREKQYNFLCQVLTGENVYFGERPRNAHHWMVISNELFDYREELFAQCMRAFNVPESLIKRLRRIHEYYRQDIVKKMPWKKKLFGKEVPFEGFDTLTLEDATLCDSCQQEINAGSQVQYHLRLGKVYCAQCQNVNAL